MASYLLHAHLGLQTKAFLPLRLFHFRRWWISDKQEKQQRHCQMLWEQWILATEVETTNKHPSKQSDCLLVWLTDSLCTKCVWIRFYFSDNSVMKGCAVVWSSTHTFFFFFTLFLDPFWMQYWQCAGDDTTYKVIVYKLYSQHCSLSHTTGHFYDHLQMFPAVFVANERWLVFTGSWTVPSSGIYNPNHDVLQNLTRVQALRCAKREK